MPCQYSLPPTCILPFRLQFFWYFLMILLTLFAFISFGEPPVARVPRQHFCSAIVHQRPSRHHWPLLQALFMCVDAFPQRKQASDAPRPPLTTNQINSLCGLQA